MVVDSGGELDSGDAVRPRPRWPKRARRPDAGHRRRGSDGRRDFPRPRLKRPVKVNSQQQAKPGFGVGVVATLALPRRHMARLASQAGRIHRARRGPYAPQEKKSCLHRVLMDVPLVGSCVDPNFPVTSRPTRSGNRCQWATASSAMVAADSRENGRYELHRARLP